MKLIRQVVLAYKKGSADKIYEVDLCKVGSDQFVVNFRQGNRGELLQEGTKTTQAVSRSKAEKIFFNLLQIKKRKGFREIDAPPQRPSIEQNRRQRSSNQNHLSPRRRENERHHSPQVFNLDDVKEENRQGAIRILSILVRAAANRYKGEWKISRVVWKAGEMRLKAAVPYIIQIAKKNDAITRYSALWALGRCGDSQALPLLRKYIHEDNFIKNIAREATLSLLNGASRDAFIDELLGEIPQILQKAIRDENYEHFTITLNNITLNQKRKQSDFLEVLYLASVKYRPIRKALVEILPKLKPQPGYFRNLRRLFKMAEYRQDAEVFGLLAYKFEKERAGFKSSYRVRVNHKWVYQKEELKKANSQLAFSSDTKAYLKRRVLKTLKRTGELNDPAYVKMAMGILLAYDDSKDKDRPWKKRAKYNWSRRRRNEYVHYDSYSKNLAFYSILYGKSSRYQLLENEKAYSCRKPYQPGDTAPKSREEAYPNLWDQMPHAYLHLLAESKVERVDEFAMKGLERHPELLERIDPNFVIRLISKPFPQTVEFGISLAKAMYNPRNPNQELLIALVNSPVKIARDLAINWIKEQRTTLLKNTSFIASLIVSPHSDIRLWIKEKIASIIFTEREADVIIMRVFAEIISLKEEAIAKDIAEILMLTFSDKLRKIGLPIIRELLGHKLLEIQNFGGRLLLQHQTKAQDLPDRIFTILLQAKSPRIRELGVGLFGQLPDEVLLLRQDVIIGFCLSKQEDIRLAVRPIISRLANKNPDFGHDTTMFFIPKLWKKERYEGAHLYILQLLSTELEPFLGQIEQKIALRLLNAEFTPAHELWFTKETCPSKRFDHASNHRHR